MASRTYEEGNAAWQALEVAADNEALPLAERERYRKNITRALHRKNGICSECKHDAEPGKSKCLTHLARNVASVKRWRLTHKRKDKHAASSR